MNQSSVMSSISHDLYKPKMKVNNIEADNITITPQTTQFNASNTN